MHGHSDKREPREDLSENEVSLFLDYVYMILLNMLLSFGATHEHVVNCVTVEGVVRDSAKTAPR